MFNLWMCEIGIIVDCIVFSKDFVLMLFGDGFVEFSWNGGMDFVFDVVVILIINLDGGSFQGSIDVSIVFSILGVIIYYILNGSWLGMGFIVYNVFFIFIESVQVCVIVVMSNYQDSEVISV